MQRFILWTWSATCLALLAIVWTASFGASLNPMISWLKANDGPAWVQAFGAIIAICVSAWVAWWVPRSAQKERHRAVQRLARTQLQSCADAVLSLHDTMAKISAQNTGRLFVNADRIGFDLSHYRGALANFPLEELDNPDVADRMLRMQNCLVRAEAVLTAYNAGTRNNALEASRKLAQVHDASRRLAADENPPAAKVT